MVEVELQGLIREFQDGSRIGPINLTVRDGEFMTLLGPSGSGKTTTLRMVAGFIENVGGSLLFDGKDMVNIDPRERNIGMVFQSVALFPNMTVFENISFGPDMAGWTREDTIQRVEELADLLGIRNLLLRKISEVSGGEAQRVALARALATKPSLLLLDEPLSALDLQLRERLQDEIRQIQRKLKITTIYVTHSQDEAFAISDRVAILDDGVIVQVGTPEELYDTPATEFVAKFLGSGNVLTGQITKVVRDSLSVQVGDNQFEVPGNGEVGSEVTFSVKPEDVQISDAESADWAQADLVSITPQVGSFKVAITFNGMKIVALTYDEDLVKRLRANGEKTIAFSFKTDSIIIL